MRGGSTAPHGRKRAEKPHFFRETPGRMVCTENALKKTENTKRHPFPRCRLRGQTLRFCARRHPKSIVPVPFSSQHHIDDRSGPFHAGRNGQPVRPQKKEAGGPYRQGAVGCHRVRLPVGRPADHENLSADHTLPDAAQLCDWIRKQHDFPPTKRKGQYDIQETGARAGALLSALLAAFALVVIRFLFFLFFPDTGRRRRGKIDDAVHRVVGQAFFSVQVGAFQFHDLVETRHVPL